MAKNLIIYFSRRGENYWGGSLKELEKGNTEYAAEYIQKAIGGDLFRVETVKDYPAGYHACTEEAMAEQKKKDRPALREMLESAEGYDNVFVCGPCWWGDFPMAVYTQLEALDLAGKNLFPLMTHEGSGLGSCGRSLKKVCRKASVGKGLAVQGMHTQTSEAAIAEWAHQCVEEGCGI